MKRRVDLVLRFFGLGTTTVCFAALAAGIALVAPWLPKRVPIVIFASRRTSRETILWVEIGDLPSVIAIPAIVLLVVALVAVLMTSLVPMLGTTSFGTTSLGTTSPVPILGAVLSCGAGFVSVYVSADIGLSIAARDLDPRMTQLIASALVLATVFPFAFLLGVPLSRKRKRAR